MGDRIPDPLSSDFAKRSVLAVQDRVDNVAFRPQAIDAIAFQANPYRPGVVDSQWRQAITDSVLGSTSPGGSPWFWVVPRVARLGVRCEIPWQTEAGTTGQVQLTAAGGALLTTAVSLGAASSGTVTYNWLHGRDLWSGHVNFDLWARRSGGANNVLIGYPRFWLVDPAGCTVTGL